MITDIWLFSLFLLITGALIFILVFFIITLSGTWVMKCQGFISIFPDLECDYLNAQECCGRLNFWNIPKLWLQLIIPILLLVSGHWLLVLLNIPVSVWLVRKFHFVPRGNLGEKITLFFESIKGIIFESLFFLKIYFGKVHTNI